MELETAKTAHSLVAEIDCYIESLRRINNLKSVDSVEGKIGDSGRVIVDLPKHNNLGVDLRSYISEFLGKRIEKLQKELEEL